MNVVNTNKDATLNNWLQNQENYQENVCDGVYFSKFVKLQCTPRNFTINRLQINFEISSESLLF